jgi:hypothetical protein
LWNGDVWYQKAQKKSLSQSLAPTSPFTDGKTHLKNNSPIFILFHHYFFVSVGKIAFQDKIPTFTIIKMSQKYFHSAFFSGNLLSDELVNFIEHKRAFFPDYRKWKTMLIQWKMFCEKFHCSIERLKCVWDALLIQLFVSNDTFFFDGNCTSLKMHLTQPIWYFFAGFYLPFLTRELNLSLSGIFYSIRLLNHKSNKMTLK